MTDYPISQEALEAAGQPISDALMELAGWNWGHGGAETIAEAAINAFLAAEGFEVERHAWGHKTPIGEKPKPEQRLVGPWRPSEGQ